MAKVLVVDDAASIRQLLDKMLSDMGHEAFLASDGWEALAEVEKRIIDALITDIHMPNMDGIELIKRLRKLARFKSKPIVVLSTEMDPKVKQAARDAGTTGFGNKPLDEQRLRSLMTKILA